MTGLFTALASLRRSSRNEHDQHILQLDRIVQSARLGLWSWDFRTQQFTWSAIALELFGVAPSTHATYELWLSHVHPDDRDRVRREVRHSIQHRDMFHADYRVVWPDTSVHWLTSFAQPTFAENGDTLTLEGFIREITPRKQAEALAQQRDETITELNEQLTRRVIEAESAVLTKQAFLRNISHELRTPLNHIIGGIDILRLEPHPVDQDRWLDIIQSSGRHLQQMIEGLLQVTEVAASDAKTERRVFSLEAMLREISAAVAARARAANITVQVRIDEELPDALLGEPTLIAQALFNYIDNAVKFAPADTVVNVEARVAQAAIDHLLVRFEVRDQGPGIAAEIRAELFTDLSHHDSAIQRLHGGLGLGLARTRTLATRMNGQVGFTSEPGEPTCFWLSVPLERPAEGSNALGSRRG